MVIGGGIIPKEDIPALKKAGVAEVFLPGSPIHEIVNWVKKNVKPR
jgi:methylmalonyl-CoA mutase C-terminal domain/subunit